jgi:hypothetical protein
MYTQAMVAVFGLAFIPNAWAEPTPAFNSGWPLLQWATSYKGPELVCYEGSAATVGPGWSLNASLPDVVSAVTAMNATTYPVDFEIRTLGARKVIISTDAAPLLDARLTLASEVRLADDALRVWADALFAETGQRILFWQALNGQTTTNAGGTEVVARDLLAKILDDHGPNKVWQLFWLESEQSWVLDFKRRWDLEPDELPAPPTVWPSHPPGTKLEPELPPPGLKW